MLNLLSARVQTLLRPTAALAASLMLTACGPSEEEITKIVDARVEARLAAPPSPEQTEKQLTELKAALQADPAFATAIAQAGTEDLHAMAQCFARMRGYYTTRSLASTNNHPQGLAFVRCARLGAPVDPAPAPTVSAPAAP